LTRQRPRGLAVCARLPSSVISRRPAGARRWARRNSLRATASVARLAPWPLEVVVVGRVQSIHRLSSLENGAASLCFARDASVFGGVRLATAHQRQRPAALRWPLLRPRLRAPASTPAPRRGCCRPPTGGGEANPCFRPLRYPCRTRPGGATAWGESSRRPLSLEWALLRGNSPLFREVATRPQGLAKPPGEVRPDPGRCLSGL
jgi:hypothetical protein